MTKNVAALGPVSEKVLNFIFQHQNCNAADIRKSLGLTANSARTAVARLRAGGFIEWHGRKNHFRYRAIKSQPKIWRPQLSERSRLLLAFVAVHGPVTRGEIHSSLKTEYSTTQSTISNLKLKGDLERDPETGAYTATVTEVPFGVVIPALRGRTKKTLPKRKENNVANCRMRQIEDLIERGLTRRAQTAISRLIAETGDLATINWALDKNIMCGGKARYY